MKHYMIKDHHSLKINNHSFIRSSGYYKNNKNECKICGMEIYLYKELYKYYFLNEIMNRWDNINDIITCEDYIIKSIIE